MHHNHHSRLLCCIAPGLDSTLHTRKWQQLNSQNCCLYVPYIHASERPYQFRPASHKPIFIVWPEAKEPTSTTFKVQAEPDGCQRQADSQRLPFLPSNGEQRGQTGFTPISNRRYDPSIPSIHRVRTILHLNTIKVPSTLPVWHTV